MSFGKDMISVVARKTGIKNSRAACQPEEAPDGTARLLNQNLLGKSDCIEADYQSFRIL
jgi:hypothetical protein